MANGFHFKDGVHFERTADAGVRITKLQPHGGAEELLFVDADGWASIVAHVSALGSTSEGFEAAQKLHRGQ